jgi:G patch domain-containing protein 1
LTPEEWNKELGEFVRAAQVFRPMSKLMASRFTSSTSTSGSEGSSTTAKPVAPIKIEDPAMEAAKMNMYGRLTRSVVDFFPTRLLCKRFNVKDPHPVPTEEDEMKEVADTTLINADKVAELKSAARNVGGTYELRPLETEEVVEVQPDRNEILEGERAGEEVFRSIFGEDSDDD